MDITCTCKICAVIKGGSVIVSACVIFILHQKIQKMAKCTFWYWLIRVVPEKVQRAVKWL